MRMSTPGKKAVLGRAHPLIPGALVFSFVGLILWADHASACPFRCRRSSCGEVVVPACPDSAGTPNVTAAPSPTPTPMPLPTPGPNPNPSPSPSPTKPLEFSTFKSDTGRFSVDMPGTPKALKQTINMIDNYAFAIELPQGRAFLVSYFDLPPNLQLTLDTSLKAYAGGRRGTILSQKKVTLNDEFPGVEAQVQLPDGKISRLRLFMVKQRQYQVVVDGSPEFVRSKDADRFLNSFRVKD
jgi:hypothetical protein